MKKTIAESASIAQQLCNEDKQINARDSVLQLQVKNLKDEVSSNVVAVLNGILGKVYN